MRFQMSPAVDWTEKDLTGVVAGVGSTGGAFAGAFAWGPVLERVLLADEADLVNRFGKPDIDTFISFFTAANFLAYGTNLTVVRVVSSAAKNATGDGTGLLIKNEDHYTDQYAGGEGAVGIWAAKYPGDLGNAIKVSIADYANYETWEYKTYFTGAPGTSDYATGTGATNDELHVVVVDRTGLITGTAGEILERFSYLSKAADAKKEDGSSNYYAEVINRTSKWIWWMDHHTLGTNWGEAAGATVFAGLPTTIAFSGTVTGSYVVGEEVTTGATKKGIVLSWTVGTKTLVIKPTLGTFAADDVVAGAGGGSATATTVTIPTVAYNLAGGVDGNDTVADADIMLGMDLFLTEDFDCSLLLTGDASATVQAYAIQNIAEVRKDCVAFVSPSMDAVVANAGDELDDIIADRNLLTSSSYGFMDCNWKYQYDKYNDVFRWVPLNGDIAGLCVRTDTTNDPWWSPAGLNRGHIKNVVKLAWNPNKTQRDALYIKGINPVVVFPGEGPVLYGDKTLQTKPSAFDHLNVRRLFIVLEKSIATATKYVLFEFNDDFTRSQFKAMVEPFLRDVQGRRGIEDFYVVCDTRNNTPQVINTNNFVGDIYIRPAYSINYIQLNFVAVRHGVSFEEIVGRA